MKKITAILLCLLAPLAQAAWKVNPELSKVNFISIKSADIAEAHHFDLVDGSVNDNGDLVVSIDLDSVNTAIPIRNERMRKFLFKTVSFPYAEIKASVDNLLSQLDSGSSIQQEVAFTLSLHGFEKKLEASLMISQLNEDTLLVANTKPILVLAGDFGLEGGIKKLQEIAGLPSISNAVPVNFVLTLEKSK
jgi:polyisoprenoid-binding protein YceI